MDNAPPDHHVALTPLNIPQLTLPMKEENTAWGDSQQADNPQGHFCVISKNVSTLNPYLLDMTAIATKLKHMAAGVFLAQETNITWTPTTLQIIDTQCHAVYKHKKSDVLKQGKSDDRYQPGGTLTIALDQWASWVITQGHDSTLG